MVEYADRRNTLAIKWRRAQEGVLPFPIADMDFKAPECITSALRKAVEEPMGYSVTPDGWLPAFIEWEKKYQGYEVQPEWVEFTPGVVQAMHWLVDIFTKEGDAVIITPPVYGSFIEAIEYNDRKRIDSDLYYDGQRWQIDFDDFEKKVIENDVKAFILCNPHNPTGNVWTREELKRLLDICREHHVYVIDDEIHQDLVDPALGRKKVTAATVGDYDDILFTLTAASKSFNLGGAQNAFAVIPNEENRKRFAYHRKKLGFRGGNTLGYIATEAALKGGREWLDEAVELIYNNEAAFREILLKEVPELAMAKLEGTYLIWIDLSGWFHDQEEVQEFCKEIRIQPSHGKGFGGERYGTFIRFNIATSEENVREGARRLAAGLKNRKTI